jgi:predicted  nucleic acid-binding Zn-ribbon protein
MDLGRYRQLKEKVEKAQRESDRAEGALAQLTKQLGNEFGCGTTKEARKKLKSLSSELADAEEEFNESVLAFEGEWGDKGDARFAPSKFTWPTKG